MTFKVRKIRKTRHIELKRTAKAALKNYLKSSKRYFRFKTLMVTISIGIICLFSILLFQIMVFLKELSFKDIFFALINRSVETDQFDHTNFLLIGKGGENHDGSELTDTMIIASIDVKDKTVGMLSIPRDLWVETENFGGSRINKVIELALEKGMSYDEAIKVLEREIQEIFDVQIHYYAAVDFNGFKEVIDALGGIEINVKETLYDPLYPKDGTYDYAPFYIKAGAQTLDGDKALKYARSRKTTSDFSRSERQQEVISAVKEKLQTSSTLLSKTKLKKLYQTYKKYVQTDLKVYEFIYLGRKAAEFGTDSIVHSVLSDDPYTIGGFLYTPEQQYFGGAFVLIPFGNTFDEVKKFIHISLYIPNMLKEKIPVHVLNGTKQANLAYDALTHLERYGTDIVRYGNSDIKVPKTKIFYRDTTAQNSLTMKFLENEFETTALPAENTPFSNEQFATQASIVIVLGTEFAEFKNSHPKLFY